MQSTPRATIYSVASRANVSISTGSLAITHPHRVSPETRRKVAEAAEAEGYRSGAHPARTGSRRIVAAAPFSAWPSYYERLNGLLARCTAAGVEVVIHDLPSTNTLEAPILDALPIRGDLDGVVVMGTPLSEKAEDAVLRNGFPTVILDAESPRLPCVRFDDVHGGRLVGEHLARLGHREVLFAHEGTVSFDYASAGILRSQGVGEALQRHGGSLTLVDVTAGELPQALERGRATAIAATNDDVAVRVLDVLRAQGLSVPRDISLSGFDGGRVAEALSLTTVAEPFRDSGEAAADLLLALLDGRAPTVSTVMLVGALRTGRTTAALA